MTANPARRGDMVLIEAFESSTAMHGPTTRRPVYRLAKVTSIDREGIVKAAERPDVCPMPWTFRLYGNPRRWVVALADFPPGTTADGVLRQLGERADFESTDAAIATLKPMTQPKPAADVSVFTADIVA